jgi:hypothetical protein
MSANANADTPRPPVPVPENFKNIITDFISSFLTAFPEYTDGVHAFINSASHAQEHITPDAVERLFAHCQSVYPERFFDILYQNDNIFSPDAAVSNDVSVDFLPGVDFRIVWNLSDISETTKERIWKHLQLITFTIVSGMSQGNVSFGDTAKMFEAINEEELRVKLEETMANLQSMFEDTKKGGNNNSANTNNNNNNNNNNNTNSDAPDGGGSRYRTGDNSTPLPDAEKMHEHLSGLLDGKIGALAKEIAEETVKELDIDVSEETSVSGVFQKLMKNPGKLAGIVKKVGEKLDKKMKSGDIKESELFKEASDFMSKMKGSGGGGKGGMGDIAQLLKSMNLNMGDLGGLGGGGGGGKAKVNLGAMQSQLGRNLKMAQNKERMQKKLEEHRAAAAAAAAAAAQQPKQMKHSVYQPATSDRNEKTPRVPPGATHTASCETTPTHTHATPATPATPATANDAPEKKKKHKNKNKK